MTMRKTFRASVGAAIAVTALAAGIAYAQDGIEEFPPIDAFPPIESQELPPVPTEELPPPAAPQELPFPGEEVPPGQSGDDWNFPNQTGQELPPPQPNPDQSIEEIAPEIEKKAVRVTNPVAEFAGLDKITGRITSFDVYINETVQFGALQVTPKVCYSRPDAEEPKTDSFVEVDEITLDRKIRRIFTGWMFAESPGISAVEHAVYDVWLKSCKAKSDIPPPEQAKTN
jgi:hypothetical protein